MKFEEYFPVIRKLSKEQQKRIQEAVTEKVWKRNRAP